MEFIIVDNFAAAFFKEAAFFDNTAGGLSPIHSIGIDLRKYWHTTVNIVSFASFLCSIVIIVSPESNLKRSPFYVISVLQLYNCNFELQISENVTLSNVIAEQQLYVTHDCRIRYPENNREGADALDSKLCFNSKGSKHVEFRRGQKSWLLKCAMSQLRETLTFSLLL